MSLYYANYFEFLTAPKQADSELLIGLPCPLPHGRGSVGEFRHRHFHTSSGPAKRDERLFRKQLQTAQNVGVAIGIGIAIIIAVGLARAQEPIVPPTPMDSGRSGARPRCAIPFGEILARE